MADRQIQIPERREDEPPAVADQLARIRQLCANQSLQGYRFDYRKLGYDQAQTILNQLNAMNDQQPTPTKPAKQGPGCIASLAKGTTALIFWAVILAGVAGGGYLIYNHIQKNPQNASTTGENGNPDQQASTNTPNQPGNTNNDKTTGSSIFEGLGVSDTPPQDPRPTPTDNPTTEPPRPEPVTPPTPTVDRELAQQLEGLEKMLVSLSQYTRNDFTPDLRAASARGMTKKLDAFPRALSALESIDPALPRRVRQAIETFATADFDPVALRNEIKAIRAVIPDDE